MRMIAKRRKGEGMQHLLSRGKQKLKRSEKRSSASISRSENVCSALLLALKNRKVGRRRKMASKAQAGTLRVGKDVVGVTLIAMSRPPTNPLREAVIKSANCTIQITPRNLSLCTCSELLVAADRELLPRNNPYDSRGDLMEVEEVGLALVRGAIALVREQTAFHELHDDFPATFRASTPSLHETRFSNPTRGDPSQCSSSLRQVLRTKESRRATNLWFHKASTHIITPGIWTPLTVRLANAVV